MAEALAWERLEVDCECTGSCLKVVPACIYYNECWISQAQGLQVHDRTPRYFEYDNLRNKHRYRHNLETMIQLVVHSKTRTQKKEQELVGTEIVRDKEILCLCQLLWDKSEITPPPITTQEERTRILGSSITGIVATPAVSSDGGTNDTLSAGSHPTGPPSAATHPEHSLGNSVEIRPGEH
jgi:hypothetical protein